MCSMPSDLKAWDRLRLPLASSLPETSLEQCVMSVTASALLRMHQELEARRIPVVFLQSLGQLSVYV